MDLLVNVSPIGLFGLCVWFLFYYVLLSDLSNFAIIFTEKRELVALLQVSSCCIVTVSAIKALVHSVEKRQTFTIVL